MKRINSPQEKRHTPAFRRWTILELMLGCGFGLMLLVGLALIAIEESLVSNQGLVGSIVLGLSCVPGSIFFYLRRDSRRDSIAIVQAMAEDLLVRSKDRNGVSKE